MLLWDLDDILQDSGKILTSQAAMVDSDSDEMETDTSPPKNNKGIPRAEFHVVKYIWHLSSIER